MTTPAKPEGTNYARYAIALLLLLGIVTYLAGEWNGLVVHRRELAVAAALKQSRETDEDVANRLQIELESLNRLTYWAGALHHLSIAFFISLVTIVVVENRSRKDMLKDLTGHLDEMRTDLDRHLEEIKQNVWQALGKRLIGEGIATELESVMKENAAKQDCFFVITFLPTQPDVPSSHVVVRVENTFKLRNLTGRTGETHLLRASISNYETFGIFPRFTTFKIDGIEQDLSALVAKAAKPGSFSQEVKLPTTPDGRLEIVMGMEVAYNQRDSESFITEIPLEGVNVVVVNQIPHIIGSLDFDLFHGAGVAEHPTAASWSFNRVLLPGQGFCLGWEPAACTRTPAPKAADASNKDRPQ